MSHVYHFLFECLTRVRRRIKEPSDEPFSHLRNYETGFPSSRFNRDCGCQNRTLRSKSLYQKPSIYSPIIYDWLHRRIFINFTSKKIGFTFQCTFMERRHGGIEICHFFSIRKIAVFGKTCSYLAKC